MILLHVAMSVDGFIAGPGHDMSWTGGAEYDTTSPLADEVAAATGAVLAGRGWYDVASADESGAVAGIYGGDWSGSVVVVTHRPNEIAAEPGLETATDLEMGLTRAKELAGVKASPPRPTTPTTSSSSNASAPTAPYCRSRGSCCAAPTTRCASSATTRSRRPPDDHLSPVGVCLARRQR